MEGRTGEVPELLQRGRRVPGSPVGAGRRHGVVGVGHVHNVRGDRDLVPAQSVGVAASIRPLVVQLDNRDVGREKRNGLQDPRPRAGVLLDDVELGGRQRRGLSSTASGTPILPMSCSSAPRRITRFPRRAGAAIVDGNRQHADPLGVPSQVRVARVERHRERMNCPRVGALRLILGGRDGGDESVERVGQLVDLEARSARHRQAGHVPGRGHALQRRRELSDGSVIIRASQKLAARASSVATAAMTGAARPSSSRRGGLVD
jgi:hypothetical protein